jgi:polar amino acid transport system substrate-binding protein
MTNTLRRRAVRTAVSALLAIPALALVPLTAHADALDNITKAGVLKVAVPEDYPPWGGAGGGV